ncbi:hypothetical protein FACS1894199_07460 [Bacteroidia bacterium]|nr:hypothetical protein FACS1894199_07460 [Bacteroidia bacterium]
MKLKLKHTAFCFIVSALAVSCNSDKFSQVELGLPVPLKYSQRKNISVEMLMPTKIWLYNDKIIVYDQVREDFFKVFDRKNLEYKFSFGTYGQGPNEFISTDPESINPSTYFEVLDLAFGRVKLYYYTVTDTGAFPMDQTLLVKHNYPMQSFKKISDSLYLLDNNTSSEKFENEFILYDAPKQNIKEEFGDVIFFDETLKEKHADEQFSALLKSTTVNRFNDKFATFYYKYPYFKIFSADKSYNTYHIKNVEQNKPDMMYFASSYSTEKFIYVLWLEKPKNEIFGDIENFRPQLLVFDWEGNLVRNYLMDIPAITFAVQEDDSKLYATTIAESDMNTLYVYDLHDLQQANKIVSFDELDINMLYASNLQQAKNLYAVSDELDINTLLYASNSQQTKNNDFVQLKNDFYSLNMLKPYKFTEDKDKERNKTLEKDGYLRNVNYFAQGHNPTFKGIESIMLTVNIPQNEQNNPQTYLKKRIEDLHKIAKDLNTQTVKIGNKEVIQSSYYKNMTGYSGEDAGVQYVNEFLFCEGKNIIEMHVCSTVKDVDKYMDSFKSVVSSFSWHYKKSNKSK